jgi:hypothetical protein
LLAVSSSGGNFIEYGFMAPLSSVDIDAQLVCRCEASVFVLLYQ